ncbi:MAG: glycosyltransferase family 4 protein [Gemmatimonadaceae bacterium]|nr:glycosyltransferase family 4 protein [Gemmatimonadaceae bacterium]
MNVLVLSHLYPNSVSRIYGNFVHNQLRFLRGHCRIEVVAPVPWFPLPGFGTWSEYRHVPRFEVLDGIRVRHPRRLALPRRLLFTRLWRFHLKALLRSVEKVPDLVHAHCAYPDGRAAGEYGARTGRPVVITVHGSDIKVLPRLNPRWRQLTVEALTRAAAVIAVSHDLRKEALELGVRPDRVRCIPNGVDCRLFSGRGSRPPGEGGWRLLYVGRFVETKGLRVLLEALARVRRHRSDVSLALIGGHAATGAADPFLPQVRELGLSDCVSFEDAMPWEDLPGRMAASDLFVLPSFSEGLTTSLLEAMACGLPSVVTRCGGPEEIVDDSSGRLVAVGDPEDLASGILSLIAEYQSYDRRAIRERTVERYDYRRVAGQIHALYEEVLAGQGSKP